MLTINCFLYELAYMITYESASMGPCCLLIWTEGKVVTFSPAYIRGRC